MHRALVVVFVTALAAAGHTASATEESTLTTIVNNPVAAKAKPRLRAYLSGAASVVLSEYKCDAAARQILSDPAKLIDALVASAKSPWGTLDYKHGATTTAMILTLATEELKCQRR